MIRVVATYTTIPSRYDEVKQSILSLRNQTHKLDAIYLTIPQRSHRLNKEYPPIPEDLSELCTIVRTDADYGPITKIYGALVSEKDPNTVIFSCDDDVIFSPNHIEIMLSHHRNNPEIAICGTGALIGKGLSFVSIVSTVEPFQNWNGLTGFNLGPNGRKVDLIFGVAGVLYVRKFFPPNDSLYENIFKHSLDDESIFHNDDVLISGYLSKQGISRYVFYDIPTINHANGPDALSSDIFKMIFRLNTAISKVKELGLFTQMETLSIDETCFTRICFVIIIIIIMIVLCFYVYQII